MTSVSAIRPVDSILSEGVTVRRDGAVDIDTAWEPLGVTDQFLDHADTYHERYFNNDHWSYIVDRLLTGVDRSSNSRVLDIGSGSGNTIVPLLRALPKASVVASDISPNLLHILVDQVGSQPEFEGRLRAYCFDLHKDFFLESSFDHVIGGAILHHMLDPVAALRNVAKWVRPGGMVALSEPMEVGAHLFSMIYHLLLEELGDQGPVEITSFLRAMVEDHDARLGDRVKSWTPDLDDKWFFSPTRVREMARELDFSRWDLYPFSDHHDHMIEEMVVGTLRVSGMWPHPIPEQFSKLLKELDLGISNELKNRAQPNGIIRFFK